MPDAARLKAEFAVHLDGKKLQGEEAAANVQVLNPAGLPIAVHAFALADNGTFAVSIQLGSLGAQQVRATDQNFVANSNNIIVVP